MTLKSDSKFEEKLTCGLENDMRKSFQNGHHNLTNLDPSTRMSQNCALIGFLLTNVYNV